MKTIDEQRNEFVALCHDLKIQLNPIVGRVAVLLGDGGEFLNVQQKAGINNIRSRCRILLDLIEECLSPLKSDKTKLSLWLERPGIDKEQLFAEFVLDFTSEVLMPINFIIGFSRLLLVREPDPLNDKQKEEIDHIHILGQKLSSIVIEFRHLKMEEYDK